MAAGGVGVTGAGSFGSAVVDGSGGAVGGVGGVAIDVDGSMEVGGGGGGGGAVEVTGGGGMP